jgi:hypothetical protein
VEPEELLQRHPALSPAWPQIERQRRRFLEALRRAPEDHEASIVQRLGERAEMPLALAMRELLALNQSTPRADERLARIAIAFDEQLESRLDEVSQAAAGHDFSSIREAIARRGYRSVHSAALAAAAISLWRGVLGFDSDDYWRHAIATGHLALLGVKDSEPERDRAFAAGLLHGIGRLVRADPAMDARRPTDREQQTAGAAVMAALRLPEWLAATTPCGGGPEVGGVSATVAEACLAADLAGFRAYGTRDAGRPTPDLLAEMERAGGVEWLEERVRVALAAALGGIRHALLAA